MQPIRRQFKSVAQSQDCDADVRHQTLRCPLVMVDELDLNRASETTDHKAKVSQQSNSAQNRPESRGKSHLVACEVRNGAGQPHP